MSKVRDFTRRADAAKALTGWYYRPSNRSIYAKDGAAVLFVIIARQGPPLAAGPDVPEPGTSIGRLAAAAPAMRDALLACQRAFAEPSYLREAAGRTTLVATIDSALARAAGGGK